MGVASRSNVCSHAVSTCGLNKQKLHEIKGQGLLTETIHVQYRSYATLSGFSTTFALPALASS